MGAAASLTAPQNSGEQEFDPLVFPKHGIRLSFYDEFINSFGGRDAFEGMTTNDVCEKMIKPTTANQQLSFCDMLKQVSHPAVGQATVFISHAWKYQFLDVCDALLEHFRDKLDTIVWFDLFAVNQHRSPGLPFEWWTTTFQSAIREFGHTVMVLAPWNDPIPLTRAWCLWELYSAVITNCKFEIAFSVEERDTFFEDIGRDPIGNVKKMMATVNVERSECYKPEDRLQIFSVIKESVGFNHLNSVVFDRLRKWVMDTLEQRLKEEDIDDRDTIILSNSLGSLYMNQGQVREALPHLEKVCSMMERLCGIDDVNTNNARLGLAAAHQSLGDLAKASEIYNQCLQTLRKTVGDEHPSTIATIQCLASLHEARGDYRSALPILEDTVQLQIKLLGSKEHPTVLQILSKVANAHIVLNNFSQAISILLENLDICKRVLGVNHPDTLMTQSTLAKAYCHEGKEFDRALSLYQDCWEKCNMILGPLHQQTLQVLDALSYLYQRMNQVDKAISTLEQVVELRIQQAGEDHPSTLTSIHNLGKKYHSHHEYDKAMVTLQRCLTARQRVIGPNHRWTLQTLYDIGLVHEAKREFEQAKAIYTECLKFQLETLGESHEETMRTKQRLEHLP